MTLTQLLADCYRRLGYASSPASDVTTRLTAFLNETHRELLTLQGMSRLRDGSTTFASVASTATVALPPAIAQVKAIRETTNDVKIEEASLEWYRTVEPDPSNNTGTPSHWINLGFSAVASQPSDASEIFVKSTSASDTNTAYIEVVRTGGYRRTLSVTMTGTTAVSLGSAITDATEVTRFYLSAAAVGTVTLLEDSGTGTELARIPIGQTFSKYILIALWPTPASAITYTVDYVRVIDDLANGTDEPAIPADFHDLVAMGARLKEYEKRDDSRYASLRQEYLMRLRELKYFLWNPPDWEPHIGLRPRGARNSRLGGQYPVV